MKQFLTVLKFELNNYFKNKSFIITTVVFAILLAGVVIVPTFIPGLLGRKRYGGGAGRRKKSGRSWNLCSNR